MTSATLHPDVLHCLIITYNRAKRLEKTLEALEKSPFKSCRITVLDNASTDATKSVAESFASKFETYEVITHPYNIGLSGNLLRAFELSRGAYTWVLADDDALNFEEVDDVIECLCSGKADLLSLSLHSRPPKTSGNYYFFKDSVENHLYFFRSFTFLSNTIFRTSLLDSQVLHTGQRMSHTLLPQFPLLIKAALKNSSYYCSKKEVVFRKMEDLPSWAYSVLWYGWAENCAEIKDAKLKKLALEEIFLSDKPLGLVLSYVILLARARNEPEHELYFWSLRFLPKRDAIPAGFVFLISLLPQKLIYAAFSLFKRIRKKETNLTCITDHLNSEDRLRR